ncbi:hypothetical protein [Flavobacterium sp. ZS1P14]|uniref:hypothetical protein n=1 Tax=Flavobacterium sp. ZS1P14 TaxID=3401729 RepID=UPI003AAE4AC1
MNAIKLIIQILVAVINTLAALLSILILIRLRWPATVLWFLKLYTSALAPLLFLTGLLSTIVGLTTGSVFITWIGFYDVIFYFIHIIRVTRPPHLSGSFEQAFGLQWENRINPEQKSHFLPKRTIVLLPTVPNPRIVQDIVFSVVPGTNRQLLCDVWQPPDNVIPSGMAFIYLHGSAWYFLDKI